MKRFGSVRRICLFILAVIAAVCFGLGCGGDAEQTVKSVKITNKISVMSLGDVHGFRSEITGITEAAEWSSDNPEVIGITADGTATALKAGSATVTLSAGDLTDSVTVTVSDEDVPVLNKNKSDDIVLYKGNFFQLQPSVTYKGKTVTDDIDYAFVSDNPEVAAVDENGKVSAADIGECSIAVTAEYRFTELSAAYKVRVVDGNFLTLSMNSAVLSTLDYQDKVSSVTLEAVLYRNSNEVTDFSVNWESSDSGVVTVSDGVLSAVGAGTAVITAESDGFSDSCTVTVEKPVIETGFSFDYETLNDIVLPDYDIADFDEDNITAVMYDGTDVYADKKIDKDKCIGSPEAKDLVIVTKKAEYEVSVTVYNKIVKNKADLENVTAGLAVFDVDPKNKAKGKYYDGYVVIDADIEYDGPFHAIAHGSECAPDGHSGVFYTDPTVNGFRGEIDGRGHTISGLVIEETYSGFVGAMNDGSYLHDINLENVTVKAKMSGGVTSMVYGSAVLENVSVSGKLDITGMSFANSYEAAGLFCNSIGNNACSFTDCVANLTEPFDLRDAAKQKIAVFGYTYTNTSFKFTDCAVIGTDRLFGFCDMTNVANVENEFDIMKEFDGITLFSSESEYLVDQAVKDGYVRDDSLSKDATCMESGKIVLKKTGEDDMEFVIPALGHDFDVEGHCRRAGCTATLTSRNAEADVKDGFDFKSLKGGEEVLSVTFEGTPVAHTDGVIEFGTAEASMTPKTYRVTYADGNAVDVALTIYSVLISDEKELRGAHEYQTVVTDQYGSKIGGYFKFDENVTMTQGAWKKEDMFGFGPSSWYSGIYGFVGTIDGNGKTITGLEIDGVQNLTSGNGFIYTLAEGGVIKDLTFEGAKMNISGGCNGGFIAAHVQGGTIENVKITVTYPEGYAEGDPVNYARAGGVLLGEMGRNKENTTVTVKNVTVIAGDEATGSRQYSSPIGCKKDEAGSVSKDKIKFEDVTFVGFETLMVWVGGVRVTTAEGLEDYITCTNVVSMTAEEYQASLA